VCASYGLGGQGQPVYLRGLDLFPEEAVSLFESWLEERGGEARLGTTRGPKGPFSPVFGPDGFEESWWWLWVGGAPAKGMSYNARSEKLVESRQWRPAFQRRIIIPASHYFETANVPAMRGRFRFTNPDGTVLFIAGVSSLIRDQPVPSSFAMVTREPTQGAAQVHDRMPLVVPASFVQTWLDPDRAGDEELRAEALQASDEVVGGLVYERV